jgi:hypothetical protein
VTDASGEVVNQVETVTDEFGRTARYIYDSIKDFKDTLDQQSEFYLYENTSLVINNQILFGTSDDALIQYRYVGDSDGEPIGILNYFRNDNMICLRCYYDECRLVDETYDGELVTLDNGKRKIEVQVSISGKPLKEGSIATGGPRCFKSGNVDTGESYDVFGLFLVADAEKENLTYTIDGKKATPIESSLNGDHSFVVMFDRTGLSIGKHKVVVKTKSGKYKKYVATVTITKENVVYSK